ncbi:AI-2E family transporter [uncultured Friedmanniella sp.]|uniref:AI-2E family transporter n=1 Tax=uncultured Friedmanniella sp. TaxID=335381 RepID=UPI0035CA27A7
MGLPSSVWTGVTGWREAVVRRAESAPAGPNGHEPPAVVPVLTASEDIDRAVPAGLRLAASWAWRIILVSALLYGLARVAGYLSEVVIPVAVAILLAAMLTPVANRLRAWGWNSGAASAVTLLGGIVLIAGALTLITSQIVAQAADLSTNVVAGFNNLVTSLQNSRLPINASYFDTAAWGERIQKFLTESRSTIASYAAEVGSQVGHFVAGLAITLFSLFYFLYDGRGIFTALLRFFPRESRSRVDHAASNGWRALSGYVRATILVALSDAVVILIGALLLGVPVAPALAALVFIGAFVPLVGAFVSGTVAVLVALVALGWVQALIMLGIIIFVLEVEGHLLQPLLLGRAVKLHPLAVLLSIASGIVVAGIIGALLAVPLLAFAKSFVEYLRGHKIPRTDATPSPVGDEPDAGAAVPDQEPAAASDVESGEPAGTDPVPVPDRG